MYAILISTLNLSRTSNRLIELNKILLTKKKTIHIYIYIFYMINKDIEKEDIQSNYLNKNLFLNSVEKLSKSDCLFIKCITSYGW